MKYTRATPQALSLGDRLLSVLVSLFFSVPTAILLWVLANVELALYWWSDGPGLTWLFVLVAVFGVSAFIMPRLFPSILSTIWQGIIWFWR